MVLVGALVVAWSLLLKSLSSAGFLISWHQDLRSGLEWHFLTGSVLASWTFYYMIDHWGLSQGYFLVTGLPLGIIVCVSALAVLMENEKRRLLLAGLFGLFAFLSMSFIEAQRLGKQGYGTLERILLPMAGLAIATFILWRLTRKGRIFQGLSMLALIPAMVLGAAIPLDTGGLVGQTSYWKADRAPEVKEGAGNWVSRAEQEAMVWLRENSYEVAIYEIPRR